MACNSKDNTLKHLRKIGVLDEYGRVINIQKLGRVNNLYLEHIKNEYGLEPTTPLLSYREVKRQSNESNSNFKYQYILETNDSAFNDIDNKINNQQEDLFEPIDYFEDYYAPNADEDVTPKYEKYIQYKQNLLSRLEDRLSKIKADKKKFSSDPTTLKELTALQNTIEDRIEGVVELNVPGIRQEIADLEKAPPIDKFKFYAEADFERLKQLSQSENAEDLKEARVIINFYKALGNFDNTDNHPLFNIEDIIGENGKVSLPEETINFFLGLKEEAISYSNIINKKEKQAILSNVNTNTKVKDLFPEDLDYNELFHKEKGLKDTPWVDMFIMDITNGIFSTNGIIPQVMMNNIQNAFESNLVYSRTVEKRLNDMQQKVEEELRGLGYDLAGASGILGLKGVSYDLFKAEDSNGQFKDSIVQRYDSSYIDSRNKMFFEFDKSFSKALNIEDPGKKQVAIKEAYTKRDNWYRKNTIVLDVRKLPEIFSGNTFTDRQKEDYKRSLIDILGEQGYNEEIRKQKKLIKDYETMLEVFTDKVKIEEDTVEAQDRRVKMWIKKNSPFEMVESYYNKTPLSMGKLRLNSTMTYNYAIPRRNKVLLKQTAQGLQESVTSKSTGFYDSKFETIESNPTLKEFHNLLMEVQQKIFDTVPVQIRKKFSANSLPTLEKNLIEIMSDKNVPLFQRISKAARTLYDRIRALFGENLQSSMSFATIDPITGKPEYRVNTQFLKSNKDEIANRYKIEILRIKKALEVPLTKKIGKYDIYNLREVPQEVIQVLAENLGVSPDLQSIQNRLPSEKIESLELGKILRSGITHQIVQEKSFDLPKILKLYSHMTMEYAARQEVLPLMEMMKNHYEKIKAPVMTGSGESLVNAATGETRLEGARVNAVRQMNSWFERVVLGDYGSKNELGKTNLKRAIKLGLNKEEGNTVFKNALGAEITGRILNSNEKLVQNKIPELLKNLEEYVKNEALTEEEKKDAEALYDSLVRQEENLGKRFSITAAFDAMFNFIRFKGLGWNLSSYITNFMEGQIANITVASTGDYFTPENIYRANNIVKGSFAKNMTFGKYATDGAKKTRALMDRYRILQDASNELQKASSKSAFSQLRKFDPYEGTRRTEYLNQAPLMISILLDEKIVGKDGTESNVWDAMNPDGSLSENFATEDNINNWEKGSGKKYQDFSSKIKKTIVNAHGDYDELRGNMATERVSGKALLMFKRWMGRQFYQRFAMIPQPDIEVGVKEYKGRYLSHTKSSGFLHGAIVGFGGFGLLGAGPLGIVIGGGAGFLAAQGYGSNTGMNFLKELAFTSRELFLNLMRIPINNLVGKEVIKNLGTDKLYGKYSLPSTYEDLNLQERDMKNLKANLIDMAVTLAWTGFLLFSKAMLWDDEDESEDTRRKAHNFLANRFMQMSSQATMYVNPVETWNNTVGKLPIVDFFSQVGKLAQEGQDLLEGKDTLAAGPNAGESAFFNQLERVAFPGIVKGDFGFQKAMERQYRPHAFDSWFHSDEKKAKKLTQSIRASYKKDLTLQGLSKDEANKKVKKKYRFKKKDETYLDLLKEYKNIE